VANVDVFALTPSAAYMNMVTLHSNVSPVPYNTKNRKSGCCGKMGNILRI